MRLTLKAFLFVVLFVQCLPGRAETDTLFIRTDSTVNVRMYFIVQSLLVNSGHPPKMKYVGQSLVMDSTESSSFFEVAYWPKLKGQISKLVVQREQTGYKFAPVNPSGKTPLWFTDSDSKKFLRDSDFVYLNDFIVNGHTHVLYRTVKYVAANSEFDNSFCNYRNGITTAVVNGLQSGTIGAFRFSFRDSSMLSTNVTPLGNNSEIFSYKLQFTDVRNAIYKDQNGEGYWGYQQMFCDSFYAFVFNAEVNQGKIKPDLNSLAAMGPMRKSIDPAGKTTFYNPFLVDSRQLYITLTPSQCRVLDHVVHDDLNTDVVWRLSESLYSISADTALQRIMGEMISSALSWRGSTSYWDPEFRIKQSPHENDSLLRDVKNITAINVVRYWYRTDCNQYTNQNYVLAVGPVVKDAAGNYKTLCYWRYDITLLRSIGQKDYDLLGKIIQSKTVYSTATMRVEQDSLLRNKGLLKPINLFDSYRNGDTLKTTYMVLNDIPSEGKPAEIYIVSIGNAVPHPKVASSVLLPVFVGTFAPMPGLYGNANPKVEDFTGVLPGSVGFGYMDTSGVLVIPPQFASAALFSESRARVSNYVYEKDPNVSGFKYGFADSTGKLIGEYKYDDARDFHEGRAAVALGYIRVQKWGFIDNQSREIIPCQYLEVRDFKNGYAAVRDSAGWFYIDKNGKPIMSARYSYAHDFENGTAVVTNRKNWEHHSGMIDAKGNLIVPVQYDTIGPLADGFRMIQKDSLFGFIDKSGKMKLPMKYDGANSFSNGYASVSINHHWGYIDGKGKVVINMHYDWAGFYSEGLFAVKKNRQWGFVDVRDTVVIRLQFDSVCAVQNGRFAYLPPYVRTWCISDTAQRIRVSTNWFGKEPVVAVGGSVIVSDYERLLFFNGSGQQTGGAYYFNEEVNLASEHFFFVSFLNQYLVVDRNGKQYFLPN